MGYLRKMKTKQKKQHSEPPVIPSYLGTSFPDILDPPVLKNAQRLFRLWQLNFIFTGLIARKWHPISISQKLSYTI